MSSFLGEMLSALLTPFHIKENSVGISWMINLNDVQNCRHLVLSVMGPHAGETERGIFDRKIDDIQRIGKTFWLNRSQKARPYMVQNLCDQTRKVASDCYCVFIEPSSKGGALPATSEEVAKSFSKEGSTWCDFPHGLSPVTGKVGRGAQALVFDQLELVKSISYMNLWDLRRFHF